MGAAGRGGAGRSGMGMPPMGPNGMPDFSKLSPAQMEQMSVSFFSFPLFFLSSELCKLTFYDGND